MRRTGDTRVALRIDGEQAQPAQQEMIMSNDKAETVCNTNVAAATDKQTIERNTNDVPAPAVAPNKRPWTADFLLPSIRFREPSASKNA